MKVCTKCGVEKSYSEFYKDRQKKTGYSSSCKSCRKVFIELNKDRIKEQRLRYVNANKELVDERGRVYKQNNRDKINASKRAYRKENAEEMRKKDREYYAKNKLKIREQNKKRYEKNKSEINKKQREYEANRKASDPLYKLKGKLRKMIHKVISRGGYTKKSSCNEILGCDWDKLKTHLEETFEYNYGIPRAFLNWRDTHIDHVIPLDLAETEDDLYYLNNYTNLQLLYAEDNLEKSSKLDWSFR
jgi:hypothetical protein